MNLRNLFSEPGVTTSNIDGADRLNVHRAVLARKPMLCSVFMEFHQKIIGLDRQYFGESAGLKIELGAGVFPIKCSDKSVLATDVIETPLIDRILDAQNMDLSDDSVRALYGQNCFHHFPDPERFFDEAQRVITPGGGIIFIEPFYGLAASFLYKRLFASESFDKDMPGWTIPMTGPMSGANQALSYIVFHRDRAVFEEKFPQLKIVHSELFTNYIRYLLSGGLNFHQLFPNVLSPVLKVVEGLLSPLGRIFALHHLIVLRKEI